MIAALASVRPGVFFESPLIVAFVAARKEDEIAGASWDPRWKHYCPVPGKNETASKVVYSGCVSEWTLKSVFRFFPSTSVGIPKSFRGFLLFPRQGL
ncbi:hypothetical protein, partial [Citrobacter freundii]|uniref:hypothetical protein n=1 Tax=Citrobacter freundii TaxID=546 RepID=UPI001B7FD775